ncbi:ABC transporter ATP-binding protein [Isosphaeraceae bacterium EP7]
MARIELRGVSKRFPGGVVGLGPLDLAVNSGEFLAVLGPSGSGKSTLLRLVAGLETATAGEVWAGGRRIDGLPPRDRDVAMVFQDPALYPHLSVGDNLAFGLRARGVARDETRRRVAEMAELLGLSSVLARMPATLSGGQRQRAALGRALVRRPLVLLLDEPFSALDAPLRVALRGELAALQRASGTTTLFVTHDQGEAMAVGDRMAVLDRGQLLQVGTPAEVYDRPASATAAAFVGSPPMNLLMGRIGDGGRFRLDAAGSVMLGLRAEHVHIPPRPGDLAAPGRVVRIETTGHERLASFDAGGQALIARLPAAADLAVGSVLDLGLDLARGVWFDPTTGASVAAPTPSP